MKFKGLSQAFKVALQKVLLQVETLVQVEVLVEVDPLVEVEVDGKLIHQLTIYARAV